MARRPVAAPFADRSDRQHAPLRILDRQAVFARHGDRSPGPARISRVRNAAACANERGADAAAARAGRAVLAAALSRRLDSLGNGAARSLAAAAFRRADMRDVVARTQRVRLRVRRLRGSRPSSSSVFRGSARSTYDGVTMELRQAIEPWHVLGEEISAGGTARYVDSSVERLQVQGGRHDRRAPSSSPATAARCRLTADRVVRGEFVAGVRFRAWSPPSALHPTIGVQAPLTFDLVDTWAAALARRLHVPRRRIRADATTTTFPVNANEAEARRVARFWAHGHTPGPHEDRERTRPIRRRRPRSICAGNARYGPSMLRASDARSHPLRAQSDRLSSSRQHPLGTLSLGLRARARRRVHPAYRGHRRRTFDARGVTSDPR